MLGTSHKLGAAINRDRVGGGIGRAFIASDRHSQQNVGGSIGKATFAGGWAPIFGLGLDLDIAAG